MIVAGRIIVEIVKTQHGWMVTKRAKRDQVRGVTREMAADWIRDRFPDMTHDERYALIWGDI